MNTQILKEPIPLASLLGNRLFQLIFLAYSSSLVFLGRHGGMGVSNFDDAFYAQKAKEILASGSLWIINYHGEPSLENPPFPLWMMALAFKWFGISDYTVALPSALFGVATVLLTYQFTEYLFNDRWTAFLSGLILVFPGFFVDYSRRGMVDVTLTFLVTAALFCFIRGGKVRYLFFGLFTGLAVLTKSVLGFFPLIIAFAYSVLARPDPAGRAFAPLRNIYFWAGATIALDLGSSWYFVNTLELGEWFTRGHFSWLLFHRAITGTDSLRVVPKVNPLFFLGYLKSLWENYWPWIPFAFIGVGVFAKKAFQGKDNRHLFIFLWITIIFIVMSISKTQALRYIMTIFPALAILTAQTISGWVSDSRKVTLTPYMVGTIMVAVLFVNATAIEVRQSVSLSQNSLSVRHLAPVIHINTPPGESVGNYRLTDWNPRNAVIFYSDRYLSNTVHDEDDLMRKLAMRPLSTWLTTAAEFANLKKKYPEFYLIEGDEKYAYFTTAQNRENISYDLSGWREIR